MYKSGSKKIVERTALLMFASSVLAFILRVSLAPIEPIIFFVSLAALSSLLAVYIAIKTLSLHAIGAQILMTAGTICLVSITTISGGIHSPLTILFPVVPIVASLLFQGSSKWILTGLFICLTIIYTGFDFTTHNTEYPVLSGQQISMVKAIWIVVGLLVVTSFAAFYSNENRKLADALHREAHIDYLTHLPNRRDLENRLESELADAKSNGHWLSLLMIDIDRFKLYNDINGHAKGDECLRTIATALRDALAKPQHFVGRYGGEEFIVVLPHENPSSASAHAETLRNAIESLKISYGSEKTNPVTITLGCCSHEGKNLTSIDNLIHEADDKLYLGKAQGRNQVIGHLDALKRTTTLESSEDSATDRKLALAK